MAARCRLAARFHHIHGANIRLDASHTQATRVESFANGLCFSQEPLAPGQIFLVEIEEKELGWCGHLRVGLTAHDPQSLEVVPEYSLPDLVNLGDTWVFAITRNHNRVVVEGEEAQARGRPWEPFLLIERVRIPRDTLVGRSRPGRYSHILDDLYKMNVLPATARRSRIGVLYAPQPDGTADMHIVINGEDMGPSARGLPATRPLYAVIDVFASTKSVRVIPVDYGCRYLCPSLRHVLRGPGVGELWWGHATVANRGKFLPCRRCAGWLSRNTLCTAWPSMAWTCPRYSRASANMSEVSKVLLGCPPHQQPPSDGCPAGSVPRPAHSPQHVLLKG
ncbi:neuralized-like protein 2 isoform X1 [Pyrgilauda ruficollis]|uniref:neuralized-like protein 2 isoform X1 n=1 Tax=Pyrgilauda ruficollis TaxID=221976 RepID=UPI001B862A84|nr:neuralized-like protein 2 isoform X1 [Pyrgilauda ruficollis]